MPVYEYRCERCGPFEVYRTVDQASEPTSCPDCAAQARRRYACVGVRTGSGLAARAGSADRARLARAASGEPTITGAPSGAPYRTGHRHPH